MAPSAQQHGLLSALLQDSMAQAAAKESPSTANFQIGARTQAVWSACNRSPVLSLFITALLVATILVIVRPPFVLTFSTDSRRPWRGSMNLCWFSVFVVVMVMLIAVAGLPIILQMAIPL